MVSLNKDLFLLDPEVIFLNHGSFGACPRPVFEAYQEWQRRLERQPVLFLGRQATGLMGEAREKLAVYLGAQADEVVYFPNPTTAINMAARSLARRGLGGSMSKGDPIGSPLQAGDEILTTDHEYGAMRRTWRYICQQVGARYVERAIPLPLGSPEQVVEDFWAGVNERTRIIFISHITSPTALLFPVAEICRRAREASILSIVDGAHGPGQIPLDMKEIGADLYTGACHKWLCAPKGAAFLYARGEAQSWLDPLVVSWGYESEHPSESQFVDYHEWQGTRDLAAFLATPAAIDFQAQHGWEEVRRRCHDLACQTRQRLNALTGMEAICREEDFQQMFAVRLPATCDLDEIKQRLYDEFHIEVPTILWNGQKMLRVSFQAYNDPTDGEALLEALQNLLAI